MLYGHNNDKISWKYIHLNEARTYSIHLNHLLCSQDMWVFM